MKALILSLIVLFLISCSHSNKNKELLSSVKTSELVINPQSTKFIVSNLATLKLRVYQVNCDNCPNELIFETDMVIGKDEDPYRTKLGFYKITKWEQFYEDHQRRYLSWFKNPPPISSTRKQWKNIGSFGWYAAILEPNTNGQWLHGTIGWAQEGEKFVSGEYSASGAYIRVKSRGCTRVSNPAIAFLKDHVPEGSYVFRIYAKEALLGPQKAPRTVQWSHSLSHRGSILDSGSWSRSIEAKAYIIKNKADWVIGDKNYNPYELEINNLGTFLVDEGKILNYSHPKNLPFGGIKNAPIFFTFKDHE